MSRFTFRFLQSRCDCPYLVTSQAGFNRKKNPIVLLRYPHNSPFNHQRNARKEPPQMIIYMAARGGLFTLNTVPFSDEEKAFAEVNNIVLTEWNTDAYEQVVLSSEPTFGPGGVKITYDDTPATA